MNKPSFSKYYVLQSLISALFHVPVLVIFMNDQLGDVSAVATLLFVKTMSNLIFEIPTGIVADYCGRKKSAGFGVFLAACSTLIYFLSGDYSWLFVSQVLFGLSEAFVSGSLTSLIFENVEKEKPGSFSEVQRNLSLISSLSLFVSFNIGSLAYSLTKTVPFLLSTICSFLGLLWFFVIKDSTSKEESSTNSETFMKSLSGQSSSLWHLLLSTGTLGGLFYALYLFVFPLLLKAAQVPEEFFGMIFSAGVICFGLGGKYSGLGVKNNRYLEVVAPLAIVSLLVLWVFFPSAAVTVFVLFAFRFVTGSYNVARDVEMNYTITSSKHRTSILSLSSGLNRGISALFIVMLGGLMKYYGQQGLVLFSGSIVLLVGLISFLASYFLKLPSTIDKGASAP
ncbi:MAG: MFS transporter [Deltaproteobacteria bacterium]|nr:MFS transporter [Deltaproteobacteria bacterium]